MQFYAGVKPLKCEVDAYADFLKPLGSAPSVDVRTLYERVSSGMVRMKIYSGTSLRWTPLGQSHVSILWRVSFIQRFLL